MLVHHLFVLGQFKFDRIGSAYSDTVPLFALRLVPAFCGSLIIPTAYFLMLQLNCKQWTAALAAFLLLCGESIKLLRTFKVFNLNKCLYNIHIVFSKIPERLNLHGVLKKVDWLFFSHYIHQKKQKTSNNI